MTKEIFRAAKYSKVEKAVFPRQLLIVGAIMVDWIRQEFLGRQNFCLKAVAANLASFPKI